MDVRQWAGSAGSLAGAAVWVAAALVLRSTPVESPDIGAGLVVAGALALSVLGALLLVTSARSTRAVRATGLLSMPTWLVALALPGRGAPTLAGLAVGVGLLVAAVVLTVRTGRVAR